MLDLAVIFVGAVGFLRLVEGNWWGGLLLLVVVVFVWARSRKGKYDCP